MCEDESGRNSATNDLSEQDKDKLALNKIAKIKSDVRTLLKGVAEFSQPSDKTKEYRYLDEMLTRCLLDLDNIECGDCTDLRQQRKAAIKLVDRAVNLLQRKMQFNADMVDLNACMNIS